MESRRLSTVLPAILCSLTILWGNAPTGVLAATTQPNFLFILADDVGREVLQCYGGRSYDTPQLDQLASSGMRFDHTYVMPSCHPTRICLLTGQYPFRLGHPKWGSFPAAAEGRTFARLLQSAGYATAIAGKWQLTLLKDDLQQPQRMGFAEYCLFGWHEGPRYYQPHIWQNGKLRRDVRDQYGPDVYCEFLIEFMRRNADRPFFAFYSMALCHDVTDDLDQPVPRGPAGRYDSYGEMVTAMDERVGRLIAALEESGLTDKTVVFFLSDNGSPRETITTVEDGKLVREPVVSKMGDREVPGGKTQLIDSGTRVPLIVRWPGKISAGQVSRELIDASDFLPTLVELAQVAPPSDLALDGRSFAHHLLDRGGSSRPWVFAEHKNRWFVKDHRWKLYDDGRLLDVANDPNERQAEAQDARDSAPTKMLRQARQSILRDWVAANP